MHVALTPYCVLLCSEILVSDMRHVLELLFLYLVTLCCFGAGCLRPYGWLHTCEMDTELFANPNLSVFVAKL